MGRLSATIPTGIIVNTHALAGEVKVVPWSDEAEFLLAFDEFEIQGIGAVKVKSARLAGVNVLIHFCGYDHIDQAVRLKGRQIAVRREKVKLEPGVYFHQDLIGCEVVDEKTGVLYGKVRQIMRTGANDVYVVSDGGREVLIPAIADVIARTDIEAGKIWITPIKGLFDDDEI